MVIIVTERAEVKQLICHYLLQLLKMEKMRRLPCKNGPYVV